MSVFSNRQALVCIYFFKCEPVMLLCVKSIGFKPDVYIKRVCTRFLEPRREFLWQQVLFYLMHTSLFGLLFLAPSLVNLEYDYVITTNTEARHDDRYFIFL